LEQFVARTAGSELEEKDFSFVWHYRRVSPDLAYVRKEELKRKLRATLATDDIGVFDGRKIVEIKPKRMNKGVIVSDLVAKNDWDFILAIGDDYTDEDMFVAASGRCLQYQCWQANNERSVSAQLRRRGPGIDQVAAVTIRFLPQTSATYTSGTKTYPGYSLCV